MKKIFYLIFILVLAGCAKEDKGCTPLDPSAEEPQIVAYALANGISLTKHSSGLQYEVINPGAGVVPGMNSQVFVTYVGKLLNGTTFDQSTDPSKTNFKLSGLIEGWKIGIPLVKKGGRIKLLVPSSLAYGCNSISGIPGNSVLYFDISLVDVQ